VLSSAPRGDQARDASQKKSFRALFDRPDLYAELLQSIKEARGTHNPQGHRSRAAQAPASSARCCRWRLSRRRTLARAWR